MAEAAVISVATVALVRALAVAGAAAFFTKALAALVLALGARVGVAEAAVVAVATVALVRGVLAVAGAAASFTEALSQRIGLALAAVGMAIAF